MASSASSGPAVAKRPGTRTGKFLPRKKCTTCGETKTVARFPKRSGPSYEDLTASNVRRYASQCKLCGKYAKPGQDRSELTEPKRKYTKPKKKKIPPAQNAREYRSRVRAETRIRSMLYLSSKGCEECNERDPRTLEYDHKVPGDKSHTVSRLIVEGYSWASNSLREEIRKCRVLCASCHRKHTVAQQGYYANGEVIEVLRELSEKYDFVL